MDAAPAPCEVGIFGEANQGERLTNAKRKNSASLTPTKTPRSPRLDSPRRKDKGHGVRARRLYSVWKATQPERK